MRTRSLVSFFGLLLAANGFGQLDEYHHFVFDTAVGSFKMLGFDATHPSNGKLTMSFTGTVLLSGYEGAAPVISGHVVKQYENVDRKKVSYFGTGTITVDGKWTSFQWFGRDLKADFKGSTIIRLYGEYDRNGNTGLCNYGVDTERAAWFQGGRQYEVPMPAYSRKVVPKVRTGGG